MNITIFGAGYVGLSAAVCFAKTNSVSLVDIDEKKVELINEGDPVIYETGLGELLDQGLSAGRIKAFHISEKIPTANLLFIAVGTPSDSDGYIDLQYVRNAVTTIDQRKDELCDPDFCLVIIKSTVIPGTTKRLLIPLSEEKNIGIAFNPEYLSQGTAIKNTLNPSRIVIGTDDERSSKYLQAFYEGIYQNMNVPILKMSIESAEFAKYAANALLATKISFTNELANIIEAVEGADIGDVMESVGYDDRISPKFLNAGIGFGGSCFPKDLRALIQFAEDNQAEKPELMSAVLQVNQNRPLRVIKLLREHLGELHNMKIAVLGLAFKPNTNDIRETPAISIIRSLWRNGAKINVHDPLLDQIDLRVFKKFNVHPCSDIYSCVSGTHACIFLTEWSDYQNIDLDNLTRKMESKIVIDGRRIFANKEIPVDVYYLTIGNSSNRKNHIPKASWFLKSSEEIKPEK